MFYYPTALKRHTGCFSTIWLVATKGIKVSRRDFLKVNVKNTCDDIMDYVLEKVPPPQPGLPRPRFSLYLSSQLQYGVVLVFHRQCAILLEELQSVVGQLVKQRTTQKIDLDDGGRQPLVLPDALLQLQEAEGAPDPLFGVMQLQETMPSPTSLMQASEEFLSEASPERPEPSPAAAAAAAQDGITASPYSITLKESQPVSIPSAEFEGVDFTDDDLRTIDLLLDQADHFPEGDLVTRELERGEGGDEERPKELTGSITELQPTATSAEDLLPLEPTEEPGLPTEEPVLPPEEPVLPTEEPPEEPGPPADQLTPTSAPSIPSPPSAAEAPRGPPELEDETRTRRRRRRRRRQLTFFDPETQLPDEELQQQISDPQIQTRPPVLVPAPGQGIRAAAELLRNPCSFLPEEVELLWQQAAVVTSISGSGLQVGERGPESTESTESTEPEKDREPEMMEEEPLEVPREIEEPEVLDISALGSLPLEASDQREASREISPIQASEREGSIASRSVSALQDIPEVMDELREAAESPGLFPEFPEHDVEAVLFSSLLPPNASRKTVSGVFHRLLETLSARTVRAEQEEPYGDILISPGPEYDQSL